MFELSRDPNSVGSRSEIFGGECLRLPERCKQRPSVLSGRVALGANSQG
jgi:hypothetical protein